MSFWQNRSLPRAAAAASAVFMAGASVQALAHEVTYSVTQIYNQVVYDVSHPDWDTTFVGTFDFNEHTGEVTNLMGSLSQAMTGNTAFRMLDYQLSSVYDAALGGVLVSVFHQNTTDVFSGGGFATGGTATFGNQNAYVTIFVNTSDPTAALTEAQTARLAYGDCTTGSLMMGSVCMTGWVGTEPDLSGGTMQGTYPVMQSITVAAVPEPETWGMLLAGLGFVGLAVRRRARR
ncbi:MAG: hypothetical protein BGO61_00925 [Thiobacillus sp. 65-69]|jgi:hypothetical protein|nr:PEP-CTERM sorting domain-containing protein [Thiobacillus sp.]ODU88032.1 MAG: hypothetical protein ABT21_11570 [Thiobacillus sp. SCN 65-179]OJW36280.1 MAG: hypothetical protein BGO61_00925 [Thiobacillus sp. 65-69]